MKVVQWKPVSYTHLAVYKRQEFDSPEVAPEVLIECGDEPLEIGGFYQVEIINSDDFDLFAHAKHLFINAVFLRFCGSQDDDLVPLFPHRASPSLSR